MAKRVKKTWCEAPGCDSPGPFKGARGLGVHMRRTHNKKKNDDALAIEIEKINDDGIVIPIRIKIIVQVTQE